MAFNISSNFAQIGQLIRFNNSRAAINALTQSASVQGSSLSSFLNSDIRPDADLFVSNEAFNNIQANFTEITTAEESLVQIETLITRARELSIQSSDAGLTTADRNDIIDELETIKSEIDLIAGTIEIQGLQLVEPDGSALIGLNSIDFGSVETSKEALLVIEESLRLVQSSRSQISELSTQFGGAASILGNSSELVVSSLFFVDNQNIETLFTNERRTRTALELQALLGINTSNFESILIGSNLNIKG